MVLGYFFLQMLRHRLAENAWIAMNFCQQLKFIKIRIMCDNENNCTKFGFSRSQK